MNLPLLDTGDRTRPLLKVSGDLGPIQGEFGPVMLVKKEIPIRRLNKIFKKFLLEIFV